MIARFIRQYRSAKISELRYITYWLTFFAISLMLAATVFLYKIPLPSDKITLSDMEFVPFDNQDFNAIPLQGWVPTALPDDWRKQNQNKQHIVSGWYRGHFELEEAPDQLWSILIASPRMNVAVYLNHKLLGQGGRFADPVARNWWTPLFFSIPSGLLKTGKNTLHVYLKTDRPGIGYLPEPHIAPYDNLVKSYNAHYMFRITSVQFITMLLLVQSGVIGLLWYIRKHEVYYGYYAIGTLMWGLHNFNIFAVEIPISGLLWDWFAYITLGYYAFISVLFFHRFFGKKVPVIEKPMIFFTIVGSSVLFFLEGDAFYFVAQTIWYPAACLAGVYGTFYLAVNAWKYRNTELQIITASGLITMLYAAHDILVVHGIINWSDGYFIQYAAVILLPGFAVILLYRFVSSLNEAETLNRDLERRVKEKHAELESNHQKLRKLEHEQVRNEERERLMLDMHDGMGGNLVSTLAMIELGEVNMQQVAEAMRDALDDMRLMIDSMDIKEDELASVLGMFRERIEPRLKISHVTLEWGMADIPPICNLNPRSALHVLRILQEAMTNAIKHAHATKIRFSAYVAYNSESASEVIIEVRDNGVGIDSTTNKGHGINNMHHRARSIGAKLFINTDPSGTQIKLVLPLHGTAT